MDGNIRLVTKAGRSYRYTGKGEYKVGDEVMAVVTEYPRATEITFDGPKVSFRCIDRTFVCINCPVEIEVID